MPASGMPVASTITSMPGCAIIAAASAVTWVRRELHRVAERRCSELLGRPAGGGELAPGALDVEIGDRDDVQAAGQPRLRQEHGAELAGADQADGDGRPAASRSSRSVCRFMRRPKLSRSSILSTYFGGTTSE